MRYPTDSLVDCGPPLSTGYVPPRCFVRTRHRRRDTWLKLTRSTDLACIFIPAALLVRIRRVIGLERSYLCMYLNLITCFPSFSPSPSKTLESYKKYAEIFHVATPDILRCREAVLCSIRTRHHPMSGTCELTLPDQVVRQTSDSTLDLGLHSRC
jgi:hypothetical protein